MSSAGYIKKRNMLKEWLRYHFFERKLNSFPGVFLLIAIAVCVGYLNKTSGYTSGLAVAGIFGVILLVIVVFRYPFFGLYFIIIYSTLPALLSRMLSNSFPIAFGNVTDIMTILLFASIITRPTEHKQENQKFWKNPITMTFIILLGYYFLEAMNPSMQSILGWVSFVRGYLLIFLTFYILYRLLDSWKKFRYFIVFNIVLTSLLAIYACKQQWFGVADFEWRWVTASPRRYALLMQGGLLRKWSTLGDPATAGILFSSTALQCIILFVRVKGNAIKALLSLALLFNLMAYAYSGTRTATLMIVGGIAFYCVATIYESRTLLFLILATGAFLFLLFGPYSPPAITRIRTTFQGTKDKSAAIRDINRHKIQPYLYKHPIGGGIFTCGAEGPKYNPGHFLEDFQPDSGYTKVLAEQGMIGLLILLVTYFMIMNHGLNNFYRLKNPDLINHSMALLAMLFSLMLGQYSQIAIGPYPQICSYLGTLVLLIKLPELDNHQTTS